MEWMWVKSYWWYLTDDIMRLRFKLYVLCVKLYWHVEGVVLPMIIHIQSVPITIKVMNLILAQQTLLYPFSWKFVSCYYELELIKLGSWNKFCKRLICGVHCLTTYLSIYIICFSSMSIVYLSSGSNLNVFYK
jgi:hypothetical protein